MTAAREDDRTFVLTDAGWAVDVHRVRSVASPRDLPDVTAVDSPAAPAGPGGPERYLLIDVPGGRPLALRARGRLDVRAVTGDQVLPLPPILGRVPFVAAVLLDDRLRFLELDPSRLSLPGPGGSPGTAQAGEPTCSRSDSAR